MQGSNDRFRVVSLFCGAGGLDLGFEQAGFEILWSNDIDPDACSTHRLWSKATVVCKDVKNLNPNEIPVCCHFITSQCKVIQNSPNDSPFI